MPGFQPGSCQALEETNKKGKKGSKIPQTLPLCPVPGECLHPLPGLIFTGGDLLSSNPFYNREPEVQRGKGACPRSHGKTAHGLHLSLSDSQAPCTFNSATFLWASVYPSVNEGVGAGSR